jgi:dihydrofolate synthase/folylpolyglutamate synthase
MNYEQAVRYLLSLGRELAAPAQPAAAKFGLENISALAAHFGEPQRAYPAAHIAGTNGKGSTAAFLESILRHAGHRTGLNTSPHLERINERIRIDEREIPDDDFAAVLSSIERAIEEMLAAGTLRAHPTYFECITAMAFLYFAEQRVDFAVFEVGLGGRLDATNIVHPAVSIITNIDFDHENFLGHSLSAIANEKAGIIKSGVPVIMAPQWPGALAVIRERAEQCGSPLIATAVRYRVEAPSFEQGMARAVVVEADSNWRVRIALPLAGRFQLQNAVNAIAAARLLDLHGVHVSDQAIADGIAATRWPGRIEKLQTRPEAYLDGAHNPAAARELAAFLEQNFAGRRVILVYGALRDKAVDEVAGALFPHAAEVIFTEPQTTRAISAAQLAEITGHHAARYEVVPDAAQAVSLAAEHAGDDGVVFVTGSLYLVGQVRHDWAFASGRKTP